MAKKIKHTAEIYCSKEQRAAIENSLDKVRGLFTTDMLGWLARLFDPNTGGFFYSNSARDNEGFLPDIESTNQVLAILERTGAISSYDDMPSLIKREIAFFVCQREDRDTGFFFHPQWKYEVSKCHIPRLSRDLSAASLISKSLSVDFLKTLAETDKVVKGIENNEIWDYLSSEENLRSFLEELPINHETASFITSQDKILKSTGLDGVVCDFYISKQNPQTGLFEDENVRTSISTFSAVSSFFAGCGRYLPNSERAVPYILKHLSGDNIYNIPYASSCWRSLANIFENLDNHRAECETLKLSLHKEICENALKPIENTFKILSVSKRNDGSFSYTPKESSSLSQGMPVAVPHTLEGDVNATLLAVGIVISSYRALGTVYKPLYTPSDFANFLENIKLF